MPVSRRTYKDLQAQYEYTRTQLERAQEDLDAERCLTRTQRAQLDEARAELTEMKRPGSVDLNAGPPQSLLMRLHLSERARHSLEQQLLVVQASNEAQCRELSARPAPAEVTS